MTTTDLVIVDPRDGTLLENLADEPTDLLAAVAVELKSRESHLREMRAAVEQELTTRVQTAGRRRVTAAGHELKVEPTRGRERVPVERVWKLFSDHLVQRPFPGLEG